MIDVYYLKNNYKPFFKDLEELGICHAQNYVPIYSLFFSLNDTNYNSINLNHKFTIHNIKEKLSDNIYKVNIIKKQKQENTLDNEKEVLSFFKFSPLLDPIKYMVGKYSKKDKTNQGDNQESNILENYLPRLNNSKHLNKKIKDTNNSAYIDSFFYYLSSKTLENHDFIHGNDFYGSFIGIKKNFIYNIIDDVDYLMDSDFFEQNNDKLFLTQNLNEFTEYMGDTRSNRKKISIQDDDVELKIKTIKEDVYEGIFELTENNLSTFSAHNAIPFRNLTVLGSGSGETGTLRVTDHLGERRGLKTLLRTHMGKFGSDSTFGTIEAEEYVTSGSFVKQHRNISKKLIFSGSTIITGSTFDNGFISYAPGYWLCGWNPT